MLFTCHVVTSYVHAIYVKCFKRRTKRVVFGMSFPRLPLGDIQPSRSSYCHTHQACRWPLGISLLSVCLSVRALASTIFMGSTPFFSWERAFVMPRHSTFLVRIWIFFWILKILEIRQNPYLLSWGQFSKNRNFNKTERMELNFCR